jgi:hypothetical protein
MESSSLLRDIVVYLKGLSVRFSWCKPHPRWKEANNVARDLRFCKRQYLHRPSQRFHQSSGRMFKSLCTFIRTCFGLSMFFP